MLHSVPKSGSGHDRTNWHLIDPRPIQTTNPYTFFVPSDAEKAAIVPGDPVKLMFRGQNDAIERAWVTFQGRDQAGSFGTFENEPSDISGRGDGLRFQDHHIIGVWKPKIDCIAHEDRMFALCHADPRILDQGAAIKAIERRRAVPRWLMLRNRRWPDTGWYIYADHETIIRRRHMRYVAVGLVLNADDSILPLLSEPTGTRLIWRDGAFRPA